MTQPELFHLDVRQCYKDAKDLLSVLSDQSAPWHKGSFLEALLGWPRRRIRAAASASNGQIISGDLGYCAMQYATVEQIQHSIHRLRSMVKETEKTISQRVKAYHRIHGRSLVE